MIELNCTSKEVFILFRKLTSVFLIIIIVTSFVACNSDDETKHKTGWQNPAEPTTSSEEAASDTETTTEKTDTEVAATNEQEISFSEKKALTIGSFTSEIYGKLTVYFQDGYFLLFDEYKDRKFTVYAQGYSAKKTDGKALPIFEDMNFDGYTDFGVCYYKDTLNSYYFCFVWDNTIRDFTYYAPLSGLANPEFNASKKQITAFEKLTATKTSEKIYAFSNSQLINISSKETTEEVPAGTAETVNSEMSYSLDGVLAQINLRTKEKTNSKWVCHIENEDTVILSSESNNNDNLIQTFILSAVSPGATTVIFRYESLASGDYIEEEIINVIVSPDLSLLIVVPE